jgi:two-component system OmpR family sensor kinase
MKWWRARAPWTLRRRLVVSVVALFALLSIVVGGVSIFTLDSSLVSKLDAQLSQTQGRFQSGASNAGPGGRRYVLGPGSPIGTVGAVIENGALTGAAVLKGGGAVDLSTTQASALLTLAVDKGPQSVDLGSLGAFRAIAFRVTPTETAVIAFSLSDTDGTVAGFAFWVGLATVAGILLVAFATWWIVSYALRPLRRVAATATEVASMPLDRGEVDLSARVPEADTDQRTEVGQVGAALNSMLGHVDDALRARQASESRVRQFVADASHELRTPLASIRGYAELTRRGNHRLPKDVTHSLGRVESEAVRMTSLVEDLLLLARLDAGRDLTTAPVDLSRLLVDCVSDAHAAGPDHEWELDLPDEPVIVTADAQRIHQVLANLLTNARVHTPAGTHVAVTLAVGEFGNAIVTVVDDGPGIPDELQGDLFERFARGDTSRSRASGSTGLGLAIVRAVVDAHDGEVTVSSTPGSTEFRVEVPGAV